MKVAFRITEKIRTRLWWITFLLLIASAELIDHGHPAAGAYLTIVLCPLLAVLVVTKIMYRDR